MALASATTSRSAGLLGILWSRLSRWGQIAGSFVAVVSAYVLYWLIAVPLIEPSLEQKVVARTPDEQVDEARGAVNARQRDVAQYFAADAWELGNPAIWQSEQTRLLFKTMTPLADGTVELKPCTLLFFPKGSAAPRKPVIMRAAQGAIIKFDQPIDLKSVDLSKRELIGGRLPGAIVIHRDATAPGADDELHITARDVEMHKDRVWTPHPVQFRFGRNHGSGRDMEIQLTADEETEARGGFRAGTMRTLQLKRDVKMQLATSAATRPGAPPAQQPADPPLDVTCQGMFQFDMQNYGASFHQEVNVLRPNLVGEADQLNCEVLTVLFDPRAPKPAVAPGAAPPVAGSQLSSLQVRMIRATGNPVTLRSPRQGIYARCRGFDYAPAPGGATGNFLAMGPGIMQRNLPGDPSGRYDAVWAREFRFEPAGAQHVASLRGAATVRFAQMGKITADEILAWVTAKPTAASASAARPPGALPSGEGWQFERVVAQVSPDKMGGSQGPVVIDSPQLLGTTDRLEAFVERPVATAAGAGAQAANAPTAGQQGAAAPSARRSPPMSQTPGRRFDVKGRSIQIKLVPVGDQLAVSDAAIDRQAHLEELTERPGEKPLVVDGDRLLVKAANAEDTHVTVVGNPGKLAAAGMTLEGGAIEMQRNIDRLWIDGPGRMTMPVAQDLNGRPIERPQVLTVDWKGGMDFLSNTVVFSQLVEAQSGHQFLNTEKLAAVLSRPIDFANPRGLNVTQPADRPQLAQVRCHGKAVLKSREVDERGVQTAFDLMHVYDLGIDQVTGAIDGRGPGTVTHVARGMNRALAARAAAPGQQAAPPRAPAGDQLTYLNVAFQNSIKGNINRREITFGDATKTVYGPVPHWDATLKADDLASLGPQGMVLEAKQLTVREMPSRTKDKRGWFELEALGNVVGEGAAFTARGERLTFSEEKDQLILRGDGLSPAEVFQEDASGGPRRESSANELTYWLGARRALATGIKSFEGALPAPPRKPVEKKK
jgi:hypothetical protein